MDTKDSPSKSFIRRWDMCHWATMKPFLFHDDLQHGMDLDLSADVCVRAYHIHPILIDISSFFNIKNISYPTYTPIRYFNRITLHNFVYISHTVLPPRATRLWSASQVERELYCTVRHNSFPSTKDHQTFAAKNYNFHQFPINHRKTCAGFFETLLTSRIFQRSYDFQPIDRRTDDDVQQKNPYFYHHDFDLPQIHRKKNMKQP